MHIRYDACWDIEGHSLYADIFLMIPQFSSSRLLNEPQKVGIQNIYAIIIFAAYLDFSHATGAAEVYELLTRGPHHLAPEPSSVEDIRSRNRTYMA